MFIVEPGGPRRMALVLHWLPLQRLRRLFFGKTRRSQNMSFVVVRSRASLAGNSENEASCSDAWNSLFEASLLARRVDKKWQNIRMKFGKKLLRCVRGFTSFLRFAFWSFPRCYAGFILADLSAWTCCFFNFQNFDSHIRILISFASKTAECDSHHRNQSTRATLTIRNKILILVQGFSSVPFKT